MMEIILVGNGKSLLDKQNGSLIDSFDKVVRFNNYEVYGYAYLVGTKEDTQWTCKAEHIKENSKEVITCLLSVPFENNPHLNLDWNYGNFVANCLGFTTPKYPTTGMIAIFYYVSQGHKITITGFDNLQGNNERYFEPDRIDHAVLHDGNLERKIIQFMKYLGLIKIL